MTDTSPLGITACLAFKGHPMLNELRLALDRIERGEFGTCIFCKGPISPAILREFPTAHFCENCDAVLRVRIRPPASTAS